MIPKEMRIFPWSILTRKVATSFIARKNRHLRSSVRKGKRGSRPRSPRGEGKTSSTGGEARPHWRPQKTWGWSSVLFGEEDQKYFAPEEGPRRHLLEGKLFKGKGDG